MSDNNKLYEQYAAMTQKAADLNNASAVLSWDQETYMPPKGADARARQLATLASSAHELLTSEDYGKMLATLAAATDLDDIQKANVSLSLEDYDKNRKLPSEVVEEMSKQTSQCFNAWIESRRQNDFKIFAPSLAKMITLKRRQADLYGFKDHPYDALMDDYEKGATVATIDPVFEGIRTQMPVLLKQISDAAQVSDACFYQHFPKQQQWNFSIDVLKKMGFDFEAGRQDLSEHPFTTSFAPGDVRLTTRVDEHNYASLLWSCIHEGGHGLYEQGLPESQYGLPLGAAASLGIHESQSRLWENCVGRSTDFWHYFYPVLQEYFPKQLAKVSVDEFYKACNKVEPSLIRTEADELTYHFHVMIRYEIEKSLIEGTLDPMSLPEKWNEMYHRYLGVTPDGDKTGVLQDVHWSHGSFGYFPTYTLGSFYAAQFYRQAQKDIPGLQDGIRKGELALLLAWLRENVHRHGRRYTSQELCMQITGEGLNADHFMRYATDKYMGIYGSK